MIKRIVCCASLVLSTAAFAIDTIEFREPVVTVPAVYVEPSTNGYIDVHAVGEYPMVGVGVRSREGMHGFDFAGHILPYFREIKEKRAPHLRDTMFHVRGLYLFYPNARGLYLGAGLGVVKANDYLTKVSGSVEGTLGYQWKTSDRTMVFVEANAITPFEKPIAAARVWPGLTIGFGF